ncbi:MAG: metal ABC transporter solute-binding protein, Zn/Mn family [Sulfurimonadaceae bacterium]
MKLLLFFTLVFSLGLHAKPTVAVSILPQQTFVQKIAGDHVNIALMVQPGSSPHAYEPKASQMQAISEASLYFAIGVEFEQAWLKRFMSQNKNLKIIDTTKGIEKMHMVAHHHHDHDHHDHEHAHHHDEGGEDPHTWTSPANVKIMAQNICDALVSIDAANETIYKTNLAAFLQEIEATHATIKETLKDTPLYAKFIVFHPSWGYFARDYDLTQIAIEIEGKNPKPKELVKVIRKAKEEKIQTIFTQPEFSDKSAKIIAEESGAKVVKVSPLNPDWSQNLIRMAQAIANK